MFSTTTRCLLLSCLLPAALSAQQAVLTLPAVAHGAFGNADGTAGPATPPRFRAQAWFARGNLPRGFRIEAISLRRAHAAASAAYTSNLTVRMDNSSLTHGELGLTMDDNLGAASQTVFDGPISVQASAPATSPFDAVGWIELETPFVFLGPHLIIDLYFDDLSSQGQLFVNDVGMCGGDSTIHLRGAPSCGAALGASYAQGRYQVFDESPFPASQPALLLLGAPGARAPGLSFLNLTGPLPQGCSLAFLPVDVIGVTADAQGHIAWSTPVNLPALSRMVSVQAVHSLGATANELATTNAVHSVLGDQGGFRELISIDGVTAFPGPTCNYAPVILVR